MNRRGFLKVIAALGGAATVPAFRLVDAASLSAMPVGIVRELAAYDIPQDCWVVRYDVLASNLFVQLGVDLRLFGQRPERAEVDQNRAIALEVIEKEMARRGIAWADLKPLPVPPGYVEPPWRTT